MIPQGVNGGKVSHEMIVALIGSATSLLIAMGGWIFAARQARHQLHIERLERRVERLRKDGEARVALEKLTCAYIGEQQGRTALAVQRELRDLTKQKTGLRPRLTPANYEARTK